MIKFEFGPVYNVTTHNVDDVINNPDMLKAFIDAAKNYWEKTTPANIIEQFLKPNKERLKDTEMTFVFNTTLSLTNKPLPKQPEKEPKTKATKTTTKKRERQ